MRGPETAGAHFSLTRREAGMSCWPGVGPRQTRQPSPVTASSPLGPPRPQPLLSPLLSHPQTCTPTLVLSTVLSWHPRASLGREPSASTTLPSGTQKPFEYHLRHHEPHARGLRRTNGDNCCHRALDMCPDLLEHRAPAGPFIPIALRRTRHWTPDLQNQLAVWHGHWPLRLRARQAQTS